MSLPFVNIRTVWPLVRNGLEVIKRRCPEVRWIPEDIYAACLNGEAALCFENGNFIVLKEFEDTHSMAKVLWVWIAFGTGINAMQDRLDEYAAEQGFDEIRITSSRKGWAKVDGWEYMESTYRRVV